MDDRIRAIDRKLKESFVNIKKDIKEIKNSSKEIADSKIQDISEEIDSKFNKIEKKIEEIGKEKTREINNNASKEGKLYREIEELKINLERERQNRQSLKERAKYQSKLEKLKVQLKESLELKKIKKEYENQLSQIARKYEEGQKILFEQANRNVEVISKIEKRRVQDLEAIKKERDELFKVYELKIQNVEKNNLLFQKQFIEKLSEITREFSKNIVQSEKRFENLLRELEKKRQEDNIFLLKNISGLNAEVSSAKASSEKIKEEHEGLLKKISGLFKAKKEEVVIEPKKVIKVPEVVKKREVSIVDSSKKNIIWTVMPYLFLFFLLIIAVNQYFKWDFITAWNWQITSLAVICGGLTFWKNRGKINSEIESEKSQEDLKEQIKKQEFQFKFPRLNKIWGVRHISKWFYKEGWFVILILLLILIVFTLIKLPYFGVSFTGEHTMKYNSYVEPAKYMLENDNPFFYQKKYLSDPVNNPRGNFSVFGSLPLLEWGLLLTYKIFPSNSLEVNTRLFTNFLGILLLLSSYLFLGNG